MLAVTPRSVRGCGALNAEQQARVLRLLKSGASQADVARIFGVSKNTVAGVSRRYGKHVPQREATTLGDRLAVLHSELDRVLSETVGIGKLMER
jgi:transposase